jgi:HEAT repeat protein
MRPGDPTQRLRAVRVSSSTKVVTNALEDSSPEVVAAATRRLVELEGERAAATLRARLFDVDLSIVTDVAKALTRIGDRGVAEIAIAALSDARPARRLAAIRVLGVVADRESAESLRRGIDDDVAGVRAEALDAMARLGGRAPTCAGPDCARLLSDPVPHVRIAAVRAVARLVPQPGPLLAPAVQDRDRFVRLAVAQHAARLPEDAAGALFEDADVRVREAAAQAAGKREVGALSLLLTDDPARDVRRAAARGLGAMQQERVADLLMPGLEDRDPLVRAAVLHALEQLLTRDKVVKRLCSELGGKRAERRRASLYALARLQVRGADCEVSRAASDPDPEVRLALIHTAEVLFDEPAPLMRYLSADRDQAVRDAAELWLIRATRVRP